MTENQARPCAKDVVRRALALQLIVDRGWSDNNIQAGPLLRRQKVKKVRKKILKWDEQEHISKWLSPKEREIWDQPLGRLSEEDRAFATWQLESLVPIVWALGLRSELPEFSEYVKDDHYSDLQFCKPTPVETILSSLALDPDSDRLSRTPEEIEIYTNVYLLLNWRAIELVLGNKKRVDIRETAPRIFGEWIADVVALLPLTDKGELVVEHHRLIITELRKRELALVQRVFEARQKAFNWLSGDDPDWDEVTTDT